MFSRSHPSKFVLAAGIAAVAATLALSAPASARPFGHPGFRSGPHFAGGPRFGHGPAFYHGPHFYPGPRFHRGPVYWRYGGCYIRRKWVPGPFGWHWAHQRVCY